MLVAAGVFLGIALAVSYGAWSAVNATASDRWTSFAEAMLFPGTLIIPVVAVIVWLGWKANIDG